MVLGDLGRSEKSSFMIIVTSISIHFYLKPQFIEFYFVSDA